MITNGKNLNDVAAIKGIIGSTFNDAVATALYFVATEGTKSHFYDIYFFLQKL